MKTILLIDDETNILEALTFILKDVGYNVISSLNGEALLSLSPDKSPHLIITDAWLAAEDGIEIIRILKKDKKIGNIPVIIISADAGVEESARKIGAYDFLLKPFGAERFLDVVDRALK